MPGAPTKTFSATVRSSNSCVFWNVRASPRFTQARGVHPVMSLSSEDHRARIGTVESRERVEQRRLAGAVGPDQGLDRALVNVEGHRVDRGQAAETLRHLADGEQGHASCPLSVPRRRHRPADTEAVRTEPRG